MPRTGEIVASVLTGKEAGDAGQVPVLLEQVEGEIASVMADGAYDGEPVYQAIAARQPQAAPDHCHPAAPLSRSQPQADTDPKPARRSHPPHSGARPLSVAQGDGHGRRSLVETAIGRYKALLGPRLRARTLRTSRVRLRLGWGCSIA
jgi:hypothetical protein